MRGAIFTAGAALIATAGGAAQPAAAASSKPDLAAPWQLEINRQDRIRALRPNMTQKRAGLYYAVPLGEAIDLKPGITHFRQPRDAFGGTSGRTVIGVAATLRLGRR